MVTRKGGGQAILYFPDEVAAVLKDYLRVRKTMTPLPGHENASSSPCRTGAYPCAPCS